MPHTVVPAVDHRARPSTDSVTPGPVLVVDDEPLICWLVGQYLRAEGYEVLQALDGDEAARLVADDRVPIRLALIDLGLRRGDGISLAARLKQLAPTLPLVLMSGDDVARLRGQQFGADFAGYLQKPFTAADLLATVARVLAPGTGTPPGAPSGWRGPHSL